MSKARVMILWMSTAVLLAPGVTAQEPCPCPQEEPAPEPSWEAKVGLAFLSNSGNTDNQSFGADLRVERKPEPWGMEVFALFNRAEESREKTSERALAGVRAKRAVGDRWEVFGETSGERDRFAGFDLRWIVSAGGTYHATTGPKHLLDVDAGVTWTDENRLEPAVDESWVGARLGLDYEWKISEHASLTEHVEYFPNFEESSDWRLDSLTALEAALTDRLAVRLSYDLRYVNEPIEGRDDTDTTTKVALVVNF